MNDFVLYALTGAGAGVLAGLFGVGGGLIMVPALAFLLPHQGVAAAIVMQVAVGTSLGVISFTSLSSTRSHYRKGGVRLDVLKGLAPGLALGALTGAFVAHGLKGRTLEVLVGGGALLIAAHMLRTSLGTSPLASAAIRPAPAVPELLVAGSSIGLLSALVGIGGGSLTVPYLSHRGLPMTQAVGTAAAGGIPLAWGGALGFVVSGWAVAMPQLHLGYINLAAGVGLAVFSVATAPLGAHLAHRLPALWLKRGFALLLIGVGLAMLAR